MGLCGERLKAEQKWQAKALNPPPPKHGRCHHIGGPRCRARTGTPRRCRAGGRASTRCSRQTRSGQTCRWQTAAPRHPPGRASTCPGAEGCGCGEVGRGWASTGKRQARSGCFKPRPAALRVEACPAAAHHAAARSGDECPDQTLYAQRPPRDRHTQPAGAPRAHLLDGHVLQRRLLPRLGQLVGRLVDERHVGPGHALDDAQRAEARAPTHVNYLHTARDEGAGEEVGALRANPAAAHPPRPGAVRAAAAACLAPPLRRLPPVPARLEVGAVQLGRLQRVLPHLLSPVPGVDDAVIDWRGSAAGGAWWGGRFNSGPAVCFPPPGSWRGAARLPTAARAPIDRNR